MCFGDASYDSNAEFGENRLAPLHVKAKKDW